MTDSHGTNGSPLPTEIDPIKIKPFMEVNIHAVFWGMKYYPSYMGITPLKTNGWIPQNYALEQVIPNLNMAILGINCLNFWGVPLFEIWFPQNTPSR